MKNPITVTIKRSKAKALGTDGAKSAAALNLVYVSDKECGIRRVRKGSEFIYMDGNKRVRNAEVLARIKGLVLPPAWEAVWICASPHGHIQATGIDANGRKQYRYHRLWTALRKETKFPHLHDFGNSLCKIRSQVNADLALNGLCERKVLAAVVRLMECTGMRVGSSFYEKLYGSFGLTTLKDKHVTIAGEKMTFSFKGKKGVYQNIALRSGELARIVKQCRDIPGKELFQYYDENGVRRSVDSGMVNSYIKEICGKDFTAKDFRTWTGTVCALEALMEFDCCDTAKETNSKIIEALDIAAKRLGNTRTVCRKYYVHPRVLECYADKTLAKYGQKILKTTANDAEYSYGEQVLMKLLGRVNSATVELAKAG